MGSIITLACLVGVVMYAFYGNAKCDPVSFGLIQKPDQVSPITTQKRAGTHNLCIFYHRSQCIIVGKLLVIAKSKAMRFLHKRRVRNPPQDDST